MRRFPWRPQIDIYSIPQIFFNTPLYDLPSMWFNESFSFIVFLFSLISAVPTSISMERYKKGKENNTMAIQLFSTASSFVHRQNGNGSTLRRQKDN